MWLAGGGFVSLRRSFGEAKVRRRLTIDRHAAFAPAKTPAMGRTSQSQHRPETRFARLTYFYSSDHIQAMFLLENDHCLIGWERERRSAALDGGPFKYQQLKVQHFTQPYPLRSSNATLPTAPQTSSFD